LATRKLPDERFKRGAYTVEELIPRTDFYKGTEMKTLDKNHPVYIRIIDTLDEGKVFHDALLEIWGSSITEPVAAIGAWELSAHLLDRPMTKIEMHAVTLRLIEHEKVLKTSPISQTPNFSRSELGFKFD